MKYLMNNKLNETELISVFKSVGWNKDPKDILQDFQNSYYVTAYENDKLVGFARAISDGYYYTSIFDMVVRPEYQKKELLNS
ncbi:MAG: GNAT family N-acetyltransferase [Candidatus Cloacimonadota bacterium]|nr:GNAT family N-acetyltransferase [Candidatus Cloacimonadota bacterium]